MQPIPRKGSRHADKIDHPPDPARGKKARARAARLSLAAALATAATVIGSLAAGSASAALAHPARPGTTSSTDPTAVALRWSCGPPDLFIQCYSPGQYQVPYGVAPLLSSGVNGSNETVVMPETAYAPSPNFTDIRQDLAAFDTKFGLPGAKLTVTTTLADASAPYVAGIEEVEDTEMVHAIAPDATLDVVLLPANVGTSAANVTAALTGLAQTAIAQNAAVDSISDSEGKTVFTPTEVASINPLVLGVGGTALNASFKTGQYYGEVAWNQDTDASGGGYSVLFRRPSYQDGVAGIGAMRGVPDVAASAGSTTAMALMFTGGVLIAAQGTSAATRCGRA